MTINSYPNSRLLRRHHWIIAVETPADWTDLGEVKCRVMGTVPGNLKLCDAIHNAKILLIQREGFISSRKKDGRIQICRGPRWEEELGAWYHSRQVVLSDADIALG